LRPIAGTRHAVLILLGAAAVPAGLPAQDLTVPRFPIAPSPIEITGDVRPRQFLGVEGRKAAWLGLETGEAELWVHPLKLAADFQLAFQIPDYTDPIRGADVARTVTVRPEITTITYSHATFTVREHILAPLDEPGILVLLDVETFRPLRIIGSFRTVFQYAWPAAFGGQYTFWSEDDHAFLLSESLRQRNAYIGSPWITEASSHPAHALPDAPSVFVIPVDSTRATRELIPIAIAAAIGPRDSVRAIYRRLITRAEALYRERRTYDNTLLASTTTIDSPDDAFDLAFQWSKVDLDAQTVCNPDLGCGLVAGWGPSGASTRPGFGWFFGGDAAINSLAMDATGQWEAVAQGLRFLAGYQREDGKIPHEISEAAARIPWFTDFPYTYYHLDTTPYWILALWRYWLASGDRELLDELWPAAERAYRWTITRDTDGDGLIESGPENLGAIEVGQLGEDLHEDIYVAAVWIEALKAIQDLARTKGNADLAEDAARRYDLAHTTLNERLWREREGHYAFGLLTSGKTNDNLTVWPAAPAAFGQLEPTRAWKTLTKLATDSITADWGAHFLSTGSPLYDPMGYNAGAIWPFVTGFVILGQYRYGRPWAAFPVLDALGQMTFDFSRGHHPELLSGAYYRPLDAAVPQQFFATSMLVNPAVTGLLGWEPDAPRNRARLAPQLPPHWDRVRVSRLRVGGAAVDADFSRMTQGLDVALRVTGRAPTISLELPLPAGATGVRVTLDGAVVRVEQVAGPGAQRVRLELPTGSGHDHRQVSVRWEGGLDVIPEPVTLMPGQESSGIRILDFAARGDGWDLAVEGTSGRSYEIRMYGALPHSVTGATLERRPGPYNVLRVAFPGGTGRATLRMHLAR
jgi:glycogen debranching enzyme